MIGLRRQPDPSGEDAPSTTATDETAPELLTERTLHVDEEPVRCTVCGLGAREGSYNDSGPYHTTTTIYGHSSSGVRLAADHVPVLDNIGPDGRVYPFGRIVATEEIGPYTIITVDSAQVNGPAQRSYASFIDGASVLATSWSGREGVVSTSHSHHTLDEALAFAIAYRHAGPNWASPVAGHFLAGLAGLAGSKAHAR